MNDKWEFAVAVKDEEDLPSGPTKKEGDIVAVKPYPWQWGTKEVDEYLIVIVEGLTEEEAKRLRQPHYEGGILKEGIPKFIPNMKSLPKPPKIIGKNRFNIPLSIIKNGWIPDLKEKDVRNKTKVYQPFKDKNIIIDFKEKVAICRDNHTKTFKYKTKKMILTE